MKPTIRRTPPEEEFYFAEGCHILELSNAADDPAVSIARARVVPGPTTRMHRLHGITERYVILDGRGSVEVDAMPPQPVGPGDVVIIPPSLPQRITNCGSSDLIFLAVCTPRFVPDCYEDLAQRQ